MEFTIFDNNTHMNTAYQFVVRECGKLRDRTVILVQQYLELVQKDRRAAGVTVAVASILFLETAMKICSLLDRVFNALVIDDKNLGEKSQTAKSFVVLSLFVGLIVGMNMALYKSLKLPISPMIAGAISVSSCIGYGLLRLLLAARKGD